jgi:hypothetical protein
MMAGSTSESIVNFLYSADEGIRKEMSVQKDDININKSTSTFSSVNNSETSSVSTTPHLLEKKNFEDFNSIERDLFHDSYESDDTVIYHHNPDDKTSKYNSYKENNKTIEILKASSNINLTIDELIDNYIQNLFQSKIELNSEIHLLFEEFKFDIITDYLLTSSDDKSGRFNDEEINEVDVSENSMFIKLSDTPYLLLIHSIKPKLLSFSINCYIRNNIKRLDKKIIMKLLILSISIINMTNNSSAGIKLYSKMLINRTKKLIKLLSELEKFFSIRNINFKRRNNSIIINKSTTNLNLISSSIHILISLIVKRIGILINYGINIGSLWKYLIIYGLDNNNEELKLVRNIIENPKSCSCTWYNEPSRLIRTLNYIKKILLCVIMSLMEIEEEEINEIDEQKCIIFMKKFWCKFGFEDINFQNNKNLTFATKILGVSTKLDEFNSFIESFKNEIFSDFKINLNECTNINNDINELDVLSERNEDDRIRELSSLVESIGYKLDLIELGIDNDDNKLLSLKDDIKNLVTCYNGVTSGEKFHNNKISNMELKKLRMSEILLDEDIDNEYVKKSHRRSSGINVKLFTVVKDAKKNEEEENEEEENEEQDRDLINESIKNDKNNVNINYNSEFKKTLEKLCLRKGNGIGIDRREKTHNNTETSPIGPQDSEFLELRKELKQRIEEERNS